jgi:pimeloyl-ACP methyl ester carboxylesterase
VRNLPLALAATLLVSCDPAIANIPPGSFAHPVFDLWANPQQFPTPNDLVIDDASGLLALVVDPTSSPAEQEFTTEYLNTLDGYPPEAVVQVAFDAPINSSTATDSNVVVLDLGLVGSTTQTLAVVPTARTWDSSGKTLTIQATESWSKGHQYVVGIRGYATGLQAQDGSTVVATPQFYLTRVNGPLVDCKDLSDPTCAATTWVIPIPGDDPQPDTDRNALALRLERARRLDQAAFDALADVSLPPSHVIPRSQLAVGFTFHTVNQTLATFAPENNVIPFPNSSLFNGVTVTIPTPANAPQLLQAIYLGLDTLDGFSTTAPIISENSDSLPAFDRNIDPSTVTKKTVILSNQSDPATPPSYTPCLTCQTWGPQSGLPQQLQAVPNVPLEPGQTYSVVITRGLNDTNGKQVNVNTDGALARLSASLVNNGKSTISLISDTRAVAIEPYRSRYQPLFDGLAAQGMQRADLLFAWTFPTQLNTVQLQFVYAAPALYSLTGNLSSQVLLNPIPVSEPASTAVPPQYPSSNLRQIVTGQIDNLNLLDPTLGIISPRVHVEQLDFVLALPKTAPASGQYPVVIFLHAWQGDRTQVLAVADAFAALNMATVAVDLPWHGNRTTCTNYLLGNACAAGGTCSSSGQCTNGLALGSNGIPVASGWNFFNPVNFFAMRDNFRQTVADVAQLIRVIRDPLGFSILADDPSTPNVKETLDGAHIALAGTSLGAMNGVLVAAVSPDITGAALSSPSADILDVLMKSPSPQFLEERLLLTAGLSAENAPSGSPQFETLMNYAQWIMDPADPINFGNYLENERLLQIFPPGAIPPVPVLMQWVAGDLVFPNSTTQSLIGVSAPGMASPMFRATKYMGAPDDFLIDFSNSAVTTQAQAEAAAWLQ